MISQRIYTRNTTGWETVAILGDITEKAGSLYNEIIVKIPVEARGYSLDCGDGVYIYSKNSYAKPDSHNRKNKLTHSYIFEGEEADRLFENIGKLFSISDFAEEGNIGIKEVSLKSLKDNIPEPDIMLNAEALGALCLTAVLEKKTLYITGKDLSFDIQKKVLYKLYGLFPASLRRLISFSTYLSEDRRVAFTDNLDKNSSILFYDLDTGAYTEPDGRCIKRMKQIKEKAELYNEYFKDDSQKSGYTLKTLEGVMEKVDMKESVTEAYDIVPKLSKYIEEKKYTDKVFCKDMAETVKAGLEASVDMSSLADGFYEVFTSIDGLGFSDSLTGYTKTVLSVALWIKLSNTGFSDMAKYGAFSEFAVKQCYEKGSFTKLSGGKLSAFIKEVFDKGMSGLYTIAEDLFIKNCENPEVNPVNILKAIRESVLPAFEKIEKILLGGESRRILIDLYTGSLYETARSSREIEELLRNLEGIGAGYDEIIRFKENSAKKYGELLSSELSEKNACEAALRLISFIEGTRLDISSVNNDLLKKAREKYEAEFSWTSLGENHSILLKPDSLLADTVKYIEKMKKAVKSGALISDIDADGEMNYTEIFCTDKFIEAESDRGYVLGELKALSEAYKRDTDLQLLCGYLCDNSLYGECINGNEEVFSAYLEASETSGKIHAVNTLCIFTSMYKYFAKQGKKQHSKKIVDMLDAYAKKDSRGIFSGRDDKRGSRMNLRKILYMYKLDNMRVDISLIRLLYLGGLIVLLSVPVIITLLKGGVGAKLYWDGVTDFMAIISAFAFYLLDGRSTNLKRIIDFIINIILVFAVLFIQHSILYFIF